MRVFARFFLVLLFLGTSVFAADKEQPQSVKAILDAVLSAFPSEPVKIDGNITVRRMRGVLLSEMGFSMNAQWGKERSSAEYVLKDSLGRSLDRLKISRDGDNVVTEYAPEGKEYSRTLPELTEGIRGSDISWTDLTLSFLWWKEGRLLNKEDLLGYSCNVLEMSPPADFKGSYSKVRLWIAEKVPVMLKAEAYDKNGRKLRTLLVKSFKKSGERWVLKDLELQNEDAVHKTKLTVNELTVGGDKIEGNGAETSAPMPDIPVVTPEPVGESPTL